MNLIEAPSPNFDARTAPPDILVLHYTGMRGGEAALDRLRDPEAKVSAHYMVEEDGRIFRLVPEERRAWHAGVSFWKGERNINGVSIGVEIVNPGHEFGYRPFTEPQIAAVIELVGDIRSRWTITDDRIVGHAADNYHRIDIRTTSRHLVVRDGDRVVADTRRPLALYESGFAPRWYAPRDDVVESALEAVEGQTFCPYKGLASYYTIGDRKRAAWSYVTAWPEVGRVSNLVSFEPDKIDVFLDGEQLHLEPGQTVISHGVDRGLDPDEILQNTEV